MYGVVHMEAFLKYLEENRNFSTIDFKELCKRLSRLHSYYDD